MASSRLASSAELRILVRKQDAGELAAALGVPATLLTFENFLDEEIIPQLAAADVFISTRLLSGWLAGLHTSLRLIQCPGAGTEQIDFSAVPPGCTVCNVYCHEYAIAEYVFMVMAALNRKLLRGDKDLRNGVWGERFRPGPELRGRTLLILGMGHVGTELARWGRFLGMRVSGITRNVERARGLDLDAIGAPSDLHIFLRDADFIVVAVPLTTETTGMIGRGEFEKMKPGAFLINIARGPVVDEEELYNALRDRRIAGAALDVWYRYPPPGECGLPANYAFHQLDNVIMTAAIAGFTDGTMRLRWAVIAENLRRLIAGEPLENVVWTRANSELETQNE